MSPLKRIKLKRVQPAAVSHLPKRLILSGIRRTVGTITGVATQKPVVALTFDDGPNPEVTPRLLDILEHYQARATFFAVGMLAQSCPELIQSIHLAGHSIGNHSWSHPSFPHIDSRERRLQIQRCKKAIAPFGNHLFRPPFGHLNGRSHLDTIWMGYQTVGWSIASMDWLDKDARWIFDRVMAQIRPGSIILFHDSLYALENEIYANRQPTLDAVKMLLEQLAGRYQFVTVDELLQMGRPRRKNWYKRGNQAWLDSLQVSSKSMSLR